MMLLTKKIQIHPNNIALDKLWFVSNCCIDVWNCANEQRKNKRSWGKVNLYTQKKELKHIKKDFPEFKLPSSQVLQNTLFSLERGYKMFFTKWKKGDKDVRPPKFKSKKYFFTQEYSQPNTSFKIENHQLKLAYGKRPKDWIVIDLPTNITLPSTAKTVNLSYDKVQKKWYASISYEIKDVKLKESGSSIYFDPGCKTALVGLKSDGNFFEYDMNPLRKINMDSFKQIDALMSQRDKKKKGSHRWRRLSKRIKSIYSKINTRTNTYLHTLANKLLDEHQDVKDFKIGNWTSVDTISKTDNKLKNKRINRAVQNNHPLEKLIGYLTYKAKLRGQVVNKFDERGTTRTCVMCKKQHKEGVSPSKRLFKCIDESCGFSYSRDHHSGLNFVEMFDSALWQRLKGNLPLSSRRVSLHSLSFKSQVETIQLAS